MRKLKLASLTSLVLFCFFVDQFSKQMMVKRFSFSTIPIEMTSFFNVVLAWNKGVSFNFLSDAGANMPYYLAGFSLLVSIVLLVWMFREKVFMIQIGLGFIIAGGLGNAFDRLHYQAVVDFLQFHYQGWYFPTFNVADICINIGVGLVLIEAVFLSGRKSKIQ